MTTGLPRINLKCKFIKYVNEFWEMSIFKKMKKNPVIHAAFLKLRKKGFTNVILMYLFLSFAEIDLDPHRTFCPEAGCDTVCHVCSTSTSEAFNKPTPVDCPTVSFPFLLYIEKTRGSGCLKN